MSDNGGFYKVSVFTGIYASLIIVIFCLVALCVLFALILLVKDLQSKDAFPFQKPEKDFPYQKQHLEEFENNTTVHICLSVDENDLVGAITLINSIWRNTKQPVLFHILCQENIRVHIKDWLAVAELKAIHYDLKVLAEKDLDNIKTLISTAQSSSHQVNPMNVARIYYTKYFPDIKGRAIHIDADCLVLGDISDLYTTKLIPGHVLAASDDCSSSAKRFLSFPPVFNSYINFNNPYITKLDLSPTQCSFNLGVYVFDIHLWNTLNITEQMENWMLLNKREEIYGGEKGGGLTGPLFMIVLHDKYTKLPDPRWNVRHLGLGRSKRLSTLYVRHASLLHWSGPHKPWGVLSQYSSLWDSYHVPDPSGLHSPVRRVKINKGSV